MKDSGICILCMENVIMKLRCPKKHHFLVNHALGTMFNHFVFKWNGFMIPTWLAHGTEYMQLRMHHEFSCFHFCFCFVEENARIMHERTWKQKVCSLQNKKYVERICMMMQWLMQNGNVITDKCRNDMFIMMLKRCLCGAWYECIYRHESSENHLSLLAHLGAQCPMCAVKKTIWIFRLPTTKDETHIQRMCDGMMQMRKSATGGCTEYDNIHK